MMLAETELQFHMMEAHIRALEAEQVAHQMEDPAEHATSSNKR